MITETDVFSYEAVISAEGIMIYGRTSGDGLTPCSEMQIVNSLSDAELWLLEQDFTLSENWHLFRSIDGLKVIATLVKVADFDDIENVDAP